RPARGARPDPRAHAVHDAGLPGGTAARRGGPGDPDQRSAGGVGMSAPDLKELRARIDGLNKEILDLLQERADVVAAIARLKQAQGLDVHDPGREEEMLQALSRRPTGAFGTFEIGEVFRAIFRVSLGVQGKARKDALKVRQ